MSSTTSDHYAYEPAATSTPCTTFLDPNLSVVSGFRSRHSFWSPYTTDAMAFRDEKFKAYHSRSLGEPAPQFEAHYEDHFAAGSRQPRYPSVQTLLDLLVEQPQPPPQQKTFKVGFWKWFRLIVALMIYFAFLSLDFHAGRDQGSFVLSFCLRTLLIGNGRYY
ncbi:hypothetical protein ACEPPN_007106 [Leptodophora sp. 'Broadleaf-Isolate-01']